MSHFRRYRGWSLSGLFYPLLTLFSCSFSSKTSKRLFAQAAAKKYDVIIVPGVPFENGSWSRTMKGRIYWSKFLFDRGIARNIIYSGAAVYTPYCEAEIMGLYAHALGIPQENIFAETRAEHSTENLYYSYRKAIQLGFKTIALASDPFQTKALRKFARKKLPGPIDLIPMVVDTLKALGPTMTDPVIDAQKAFRSPFTPINKREGFWKRLRGTMGKNIDSL
jgi:uncharacterized SAM-binding protein YcdF (DUF218 family)